MSVPPGLQWEVLVVDNNSSDDSEQVAESFASSRSLPLRYILESNQGLSHARNKGVQEARGEIISFLDDDVIVTEDWLKEIDAAFQRYSPLCVGGKVRLKVDFVRPSWWGEWCDPALGRFDKGDTVIIGDTSYRGLIGIGANLSFCRSVFQKYGLFRTDLGRKGTQLLMGEETELVQRMRQAGELTIYCPKALVYHCPAIDRISKRYIRRWYYRAGEWQQSQDLSREPGEIKILGFPRWRLRFGAEELGRTFSLMLTGRPDKAFPHEIGFVSFLGYLGGFLKSKFCRSSRKTA
jgi:glycosyltransferase involved in cell wall biosynthesis